MKDAKDLIPWKVTDISFRPFEGYWSFNPSIHFDGSIWRCVLRCCDYAMPNGVTIRSKKARPTGQQTMNAMVIFDPASWIPIHIYKMHEKDDRPRVPCPHVGYEDMRIFKTDKGGLQGIAASLHLKREARPPDGAQNQPPEQVLLSFDDQYDIVSAQPIRGGRWSGTPQKNWVPFDHCTEPRFLYSIGKGTLFDERGAIHGDATVSPSTRPRSIGTPVVHRPPLTPLPAALPAALPPSPPPEPPEQSRRDRNDRQARPRDLRTLVRGGGDVVVRGKRMAIDALSSRPAARPFTLRGGNDSTRMMGTGRSILPRYDGLRGGTQLVRVGDDAWLGIGHEMKFAKGLKYYWHTWYTVDSRGKMTSVSEPMKLATNGIEFAAGMGIDGDRVVVSFGVDDMECKVGETKLSAVMGTLRPIAR
jgi:hypothetical protein